MVLYFVCFYPPALWSHVISDVLPSSCFPLRCAAPSHVRFVFLCVFVVFVVVGVVVAAAAAAVVVVVVTVTVTVTVEQPVPKGCKTQNLASKGPWPGFGTKRAVSNGSRTKCQ